MTKKRPEFRMKALAPKNTVPIRKEQGDHPYEEMFVMIASPTSGRPTNETWVCSMNLMGWMYCNPVAKKFGTSFMNVSSCHLPDQRERIVDEFLKNKQFTHLLWIDSDMQFHPSVWNFIAERREGIVGVNYTFRRLPPIFVGVKTEDPVPKRLWSGPGCPKGIESCTNLGFGFMLVRRDVLEALTKPRFLFEWVPYNEDTEEFKKGEPGYHATEDRYFCKKVMEAGYTLWCDHDASQFVSHVGSGGISGRNAPWIPEIYIDNRVPSIVAPDGVTPAREVPAVLPAGPLNETRMAI